MVHGLPDYTTPISIAGISISSLPIDIVALTLGTVAISIDAGDVTGNIAVDIKAQTVGNLDVDITAQSVGDISIDIAAQTLGNLDINIAASAVTMQVNLYSSTITLDVDIKAQSVGNIDIDIAAQTVGDIDINLNAQTAAINIDTAGGVNIVIDQLTQTAYNERRITVSNTGGAVNWVATTGVNRVGKFFPRGMRGWLDYIQAYCQDAGVAGGTITVYIAPYIGAGYFYTADIIVPPGGAPAQRTAQFQVMWEYDSMFIWCLSSTADTQIGYDTGSPPDYYSSADSGVTWADVTRRLWTRVYMKGLTVGDLPVSGTLNVIDIAHSASEEYGDTVGVNQSTETTILEASGMGYCDYILVRMEPAADGHQSFIRIYCDGVRAFNQSYLGIQADGYTSSTPGLSLLAYTVDDICIILLTTRFEFTRLFEVKIWNASAALTVFNPYMVVNLNK